MSCKYYVIVRNSGYDDLFMYRLEAVDADKAHSKALGEHCGNYSDDEEIDAVYCEMVINTENDIWDTWDLLTYNNETREVR